MNSPHVEPVFALDWLETAGCIAWEPDKSRREFLRIHELQQLAVEKGHPEPVNFEPHFGFLHPRGLGSGRQTRLAYRFDLQGVTVALSSHDDASRQFHNFYLCVPGSPCLIRGAFEARKMAHDIVGRMGGRVEDEWVRRLDVCLDLPNYSLNDVLQPAFDRGQFLTRSKTWNPWDGVGGKTGFTVGNRKRLSLNVYDKLVEYVRSHDEVYRRALLDRRWGGDLPKAATRIEYTLSGGYLKDIGAGDVEQALGNLGAVVEEITRVSPRPFFRMTDAVPDRKNKHQSRVTTLPEWARIVEALRSGAGSPTGDLPRIQRGRMTHNRKYKVIRGYLASAAAEFGRTIGSVQDGIEMLRFLDEANCGTDQEWIDVYEKKARQAGTLSTRSQAM